MSTSSYFFSSAKEEANNIDIIGKLKEYSISNNKQVYVVQAPLGDQKYSYNYTDAIVVLSPKHKITFVNCGTDKEGFQDFIEEFIEDLGYISDKFLYKEILGRPRTWKGEIIAQIDLDNLDVATLFQDTFLTDAKLQRSVELIISLLTGSINDIEKVKSIDEPEEILDKIKRKIQLFDGDQTRFIYEQPTKKIITIQGLSGTGKTELLLHKLKELYLSDEESKIFFTCYNKILGYSLRSRIPGFFNFMKVEQQISWESRLWCTHSWGSGSNENSGAYRYICHFYDIPFHSLGYNMTFERACKLAIEDIDSKFPGGENFKFALDYMLIDESQDFSKEFFELCEKVTRNNLYIAGDIFQNIFKEFSSNVNPDYLLGKCYRTDPKTLMFAHALGMGLFEEPKIRWLEEKEWRECGYNYFKGDDSKIHLSREPLRRFEDLDSDYQSIKIIKDNDIVRSTLNTILSIQEENPTVGPDDIGIIFLDRDNSIYELANTLEFRIKDEIGWDVNKAYETKVKRNNSGKIFISNRNNVKGLEFPFVICITKRISKNPTYRNTIYTMISRSFLKTYLILPNSTDSGFSQGIEDGLVGILLNKEMIINEPTEEEKIAIKTTFDSEVRKLSLSEKLTKIFQKNALDKNQFKQMFEIVNRAGLNDKGEAELEEFVMFNIKYLI